jgi:hypothetical protein
MAAQEEVINSIIEVSKDATFIEVINKVTVKLDSLVAEYGAEAFDLILTLLQVKAGWTILLGILLAIICALAYKSMRKAYKIGEANNWEDFPGAMVITLIIMGITGIPSLNFLLSFTTWLMLFSPKMGLIWMAVSNVISF